MANNKSQLRSLLKIQAAFTIVGVALGIAMRTTSADRDVAIYGFLLVALMLPSILLFIGLPILVHELGHYLVAKRKGIRISSFNVLGFELLRGAPTRATSTGPWGYVVPDTTLDQDRPDVWIPILIAGPLAGLSFTLPGFFLYARDPSGVGFVFGLQAMLGLMMNVTALVGYSRTRYSDGMLIRDVRRPDSQAFAERALRRMYGAFSGDDPTLYDPEDVRRALLARSPRSRVHANSIAATRAVLLESPDAEQACRAYVTACDQAIEAGGAYGRSSELQIWRQDAILELAFFLAFQKQDAFEAASVLESLDRIDLICRPIAMRVEAALALARDDEMSAKRWSEAALRDLARGSESHPAGSVVLSDRFLRPLAEQPRSNGFA